MFNVDRDAILRDADVASDAASALLGGSTVVVDARIPMTVDEQFPGLDHGLPTVQLPSFATNVEDQAVDEATAGVESRRSADAAALGDGTEESRMKSRRTRARESRGDSLPDTAEGRQAAVDANILWEQDQSLTERQLADVWLFETIGNLFERVSISAFGHGQHIRQELEAAKPLGDDDQNVEGTPNHEAMRCARADLFSFLRNFNDQDARMLLVGGEIPDLETAAVAASAAKHTQSSQSQLQLSMTSMPEGGLESFLCNVNAEWLSLGEVAYRYIQHVLLPADATDPEGNTYVQHTWSEELKATVVRTLVKFDEEITDHTLTDLETAIATTRDNAHDTAATRLLMLAAMVQAVYEVHLDIYCLILQPLSGIDTDTISQQGHRLQRWASIAREALWYTSSAKPPSLDLRTRFMWCTTLHVAASPTSEQHHVLECMQDLRAELIVKDGPDILLHNNAVMPEISIAVLDCKISELSNRDFFAKLAETGSGNPVATIESLEPLLEALQEAPADSDDGEPQPDATESVPSALLQFVSDSSTSVKLALWQRLRGAYLAIEYSPMAIACILRMLRLVVDNLQENDSTSATTQDRRSMVLNCIRTSQVLVAELFAHVKDSAAALSCLDDVRLADAVSVLGELLHLLQVFNIFEDGIQVGRVQAPGDDPDVRTFDAVAIGVHECQLHIWIILYGMLNELMKQNGEAYPSPVEDKFDFLRTLHRNLGIRSTCSGLNRYFVRLLKDEFLSMTHVEGYDNEQAQVLYDLYGINCFLNPSFELIEHHCMHDAFIDKGAAMQAVDLLLVQADKLPIRELVRHTLKDTVEKVHGSTTRKKPTEAILRNRAIIRTFLNSPIRPLDLYGCLKGEGSELDVSPVPEADSPLAAKGWYFLMGHISLVKFKSQKRTGPSPSEDVEIAIAFFNQSLEYSTDDWEVWFRLAQAHDTKLEEALWQAEKLNTHMSDIVQLQRAAIHCYTKALALANRSADLAFDTPKKMTELYADFGMRMYSSAQPPFSMLAFAADGNDRWLSLATGMTQTKTYRPLPMYTAWRFTKEMLTRATRGRPHEWHLQYMLVKVMWKMLTASEGDRQLRTAPPPSPQAVLNALNRAIELVPGKRDSRDTKFQPILEPHYKLVSIVHKMLLMNTIDITQAKAALQATPYVRGVGVPAARDIASTEWSDFMLAVLKNLRAADKSNWHHRISWRVAQVLSERPIDVNGLGPAEVMRSKAAAAKDEMTKHMFSKVMALQIWRPEAERAGRHFVFTTRYVEFIIQCLEQLKDRTSMEMLAKRIRKRTAEYFEHTALWQKLCNAYLRLMRNHAALPEGLETSTFSAVTHEDFDERKVPLQDWMQDTEAGVSPVLDVLREVQELKKTNGGLVKVAPIDDLIGDAYAFLFNTVGKTLWLEEQRVKAEELARQPPKVPTPPPRNPAMDFSHIMNSIMGVDGALDQSAKPAVPAPTPVPAASDAQPARRKPGIGRREIRTCAEGCFPKVTAQNGTRVVGPIPDHPRVQVVINSSRNELGGAVSADTSAPPCVHDDADDESDLSEFEEEVQEERKPMFPGLAVIGAEESEGFDTAEEGGEGDGGDVEMAEETARPEALEAVEAKVEDAQVGA
ncbi:Histone transcription regulator 3 [Oleoguttula sp. CCFEE 5521]